MTGRHGHSHTRQHEHGHAGQGPVLLDIGGDYGALITTTPEDMEGVEIEIRRLDRDAPQRHVGVVRRPLTGVVRFCAVFPDLQEGRYEIYRRPDGPVLAQVDVTGGEIIETTLF